MITGGAGFIGSHLVKELSSQYHITVVDNLSNKKTYSNAQILKDNNIPFFEEDIMNKEKITEIIRICRPDSCVHLAAKISVPESILDPYSTMALNVTGTLNVLDACTCNSVKRFVFASSAAVYGHVDTLPIPEKIELKPISPYGASKVAAEEIISAYANLHLFESIISLRFFNVFGAGQSDEYAGVISKFKERVQEGSPPIIFGDGNQQRDFVSVEDVVNSIAVALNPPKEVTQGTFNIATGVPTTISDLAKIMTRIMGKTALNPIYKKAAEGDIRLSYADTTKTSNVLNFVAKRDLEYGLQEFTKSYSK
ncbi:MAG: NAD-dependent epimerase/dehydratase family protein [Nitrososphaerota archaeon]